MLRLALACGIAFIRGLAGSTTVGNFYVDLVRSITRVLLPISFVAGVAFVALGVPAAFAGAASASTLIGVNELAIPGMKVEIEAVVGLKR